MMLVGATESNSYTWAVVQMMPSSHLNPCHCLEMPVEHPMLKLAPKAVVLCLSTTQEAETTAAVQQAAAGRFSGRLSIALTPHM